jgi:putative flippase GtrA
MQIKEFAQRPDSYATSKPGKIISMARSTRTDERAPAAPAEAGSIRGQGIKFFLVGSAGTGLQLGLYAASAVLIGAQVASIASWLMSTLATNATHRAVTFGVRASARRSADQAAAFITCLVGLLVTSLVLAELPNATGLSGVIAILAVNTVVGAGRFFGMRWWLGDAGRRLGTQLAVAAQAAKNSRQHRRPMSGLHTDVEFSWCIDSETSTT